MDVSTCTTCTLIIILGNDDNKLMKANKASSHSHEVQRYFLVKAFVMAPLCRPVVLDVLQRHALSTKWESRGGRGRCQGPL